LKKKKYGAKEKVTKKEKVTNGAKEVKVWRTVRTTVAPQECVGWRLRDTRNWI
jgi:hypothetical protein